MQKNDNYSPSIVSNFDQRLRHQFSRLGLFGIYHCLSKVCNCVRISNSVVKACFVEQMYEVFKLHPNKPQFDYAFVLFHPTHILQVPLRPTSSSL